MITCPNCQKGMLWGVFLDIPPEMKSGVAEWVACEPPEPEEVVICPSCKGEAGPYGSLYDEDSESRKMERARLRADQRADWMGRVSTVELPKFHLLGLITHGNYARDAFVKECWETLDAWLIQLRKDRDLPRHFQEDPFPAARGVGLRLDDSDVTEISKCRYLVGIPIPESLVERLQARLEDPQVHDPKHPRIFFVAPAHYAQFTFPVDLADFHKIQRFLLKSWLPEHAFEATAMPIVELYSQTPSTWPPEGEERIIQLCVPIVATEKVAKFTAEPSDEFADSPTMDEAEPEF